MQLPIYPESKVPFGPSIPLSLQHAKSKPARSPDPATSQTKRHSNRVRATNTGGGPHLIKRGPPLDLRLVDRHGAGRAIDHFQHLTLQ